MGEIKRCPCCLGRKKMLGFGFIEETCSECNGVGHIEDKEVEPNVITQRRRGRAPGWKKAKE